MNANIANINSVPYPLPRSAAAVEPAAVDQEGELLRPSVLHGKQLIVLNEGSVTRDFLAFERNYLSWIKLIATCFIISGALVIRLQLNEFDKSPNYTSSLEHRYAIPVGVIYFATSLLALVAATMAFFRTQQDMLRGMALISSGLFVQAVGVLVTVVIGVSAVLLIISTEQSTTS